jgi:HEAT repeat protein
MPAVRRLSRRVLVLALALPAIATAAAERRAGAQGIGLRAAHAPSSEVEGAAPPAPPPIRPDDGLRERLGVDSAIALTRSANAGDRLRGLERLAADHSPESLALLLRGTEAGGGSTLDPRMPGEGFARADPRALLVVVRALAGWTEREAAREALAALIAAPSVTLATRIPSAPSDDPAQEDREGAQRISLARREAARALVRAGDSESIAALVALARGGGPGQAAALEALASAPPELPSVFGGVALTTPAMVGLAAQTSDLRTLDVIAGLLHSSEPALRAAAVTALGSFGDTRVLEAAHDALQDPDPRVRVAGASALVRLGAPDAAPAVEALVADDRTASSGLALAIQVSSDGIARAASARAAASADLTLRLAAVTALGRQTGPLGVEALVKLIEDPALEARAAEALARSPQAAAMGAIEALAAVRATRRLAARAYFVRAYTRRESSSTLDARLDALAHSVDSTDRAVATEALVALGRTPPGPALEDRDPAVRRAAAMGSLALTPDAPGEGTASERATDAVLVARIAREPDEATRIVLCAGLADGDPDGTRSTADLLDRATQGGPDAPLAALVIGRRARIVRMATIAAAARSDADAIDELLSSSDPVLRAHVALGLGAFGAPTVPDAVGRLARAYEWEADDEVRRIVVRSLVAAGGGRSTLGRAALELAATLDPDAVARDVAHRALSGDAPRGGRGTRDIAWLELRAIPPASVPPDETALFVRSDGLAVPIAFDRDGYALVAGIPPGTGRVRLAPRLPPYSPFLP